MGALQMTLRAVLLGLLGALFICTYTYFNDAIIHQTMFVGNNMPISVFGGLLLAIVIANPLLRRLSRKAAFSAPELAVVLVMTLSACCIPGSGLMRTFTSTLVLPHHYARTNPGWVQEEVIGMVPERMLVDISREEDVVINGFVQGMSTGDEHLALSAVPWHAWLRCLVFWVPLILCLWIGLLGLSLVLHRQWSEHERLPYPVAAFAGALLGDEERGGGQSVVRCPLFWVGALPVMLIHLNNYACACFPGVLIEVKTSFDLWSLASLFPTLARGGAWFMFRPRLYFTAIAFAYFLATDVSFSLGLGPCVFAFVVGKLRQYGISVTGGGFYAPKPQTFLGFGAYLGLFLAIVYTGRHYLGQVLKRAVFFRPAADVQRSAAWGARTFVLCLAAFTLQLVVIGLDWQLAVLYTAGLVIIFVIMSRTVAETGLFFIQAWWFPGVILGGLLGMQSLGPRAALIMLLLTTVLALDTREALMPFMVNSLKIMDARGIALGRGAVVCAGALVAALVLALPFVLYLQYDLGVDLADRWANVAVPRFPFDQTVSVAQRLAAQGMLEQAEVGSGWQRFAHASPRPDCLAGFAAGLLLVALCCVGRLRFPRWPIHPVLFIIWHTYPGKSFAVSFLLGWLIKSAVTKYGGATLYGRLKPLMLGLIAGDMLGGIVPIILGLSYHLTTGELPARFSIMPG